MWGISNKFGKLVKNQFSQYWKWLINPQVENQTVEPLNKKSLQFKTVDQISFTTNGNDWSMNGQIKKCINKKKLKFQQIENVEISTN